MIIMAQEYPEFSEELGLFATGPSVNLTTYDPRLFNCLGNDFDTSAAAFKSPLGFNAGPQDTVGSTELPLSTLQTGSSPLGFSVPWSTQAEESLRPSNDHHPHGHYEPLDDGEISMPVEGISCNLDLHDWYPSAQQDNYTLNEAWPASSLCDNSVTELQDGMFGLEYSMANRFSDQMVWNVDDLAVPISTAPLPSFGGEPVVQGQLLTHSIEDQNVPSFMVTEPGMASGNVNMIESDKISFQEMDLVDLHALNSNLGLLEAPSLNARPNIIEPIANIDWYNNCGNAAPPIQDVVWLSNLVTIPGDEDRPLSTAQLQTEPSTSSIAELSDNSSGSTTVTTMPMRQKKVSILPAPAKLYPGTSHASNRLAHQQQVYDTQEARPRRSDRRKLTAQERKNVKKVRQIGSCVPCAMGKKRCNTEAICNSCQRMARDFELPAKHICLRVGILVFRQGIPDFFETNHRFDSLPTEFQGDLKTIMIGGRGTTADTKHSVLFPKRVSLMFKILEHETYVLKSYRVRSKGAVRSTTTRPYAIDPATMPTVSDLDEWGRNLLLESSEISDFRPKIMDKFLLAYLNTRPFLLSHHLVDLTCRLVSLSEWFYNWHPVIFVDDVNDPRLRLISIDHDRIEGHLSEVARSQLLLIAARGFEATENEIFSIVDFTMRTLGYKSQNVVILGLCLRRMALLYRDGLKRYKKLGADRSMIRRRERFKAMYEAVTTAYSLVYSGAKSPFSSKWRVEDHLDFGNNIELSQLFREVIDDDKRFCERNIDDEDDVHLTKLFLKRKKGGGPRPKVEIEWML